MSGQGWDLKAATAACLLGVPITVWWLVGDQTVEIPGEKLDYLTRWPALSPAAEIVVGAGGLVAAIGGFALLAAALTRGRLAPIWLGALLPAMAAGAVAGFGWRMVTYGGIGANIGGGLALLVGGPIVGVLLLWSGGFSLYALARRRVPERV